VLPGRVILQPAMAGPLADPLPLASARVRLRRFRADDLERFQAYRHDPDVGRYQGWAPTSDERARAFIEEMAAEEFGRPGDWLQIAVAGAGDALIGDIGLRVMAGGTEAEFGITLARAAQGQGLAEEAARTLIEGLRSRTRVRRLIAIADTPQPRQRTAAAPAGDDARGRGALRAPRRALPRMAFRLGALTVSRYAV
jgi:RimJ/RimL family protein N-acetyltransferase